MTDQARSSGSRPTVAVVGVACRFPDADDAPELLDVVLTGRRAFRRIPPVRLDLSDYYRPDLTDADSTYSTRAGLIEGWQFDCAAFGISEGVYSAADPALWLALETTARALAGAGLTKDSGLNLDRTGVIIGNTLGGAISRANALRARWPYVRRILTDALNTEVSASQAGAVLSRAEHRYLAPFPAIGPDALVASSPAAIAAAISGYFGFRGGSHAVDSACSSSLQAVASACNALTTGELDVAIAGGVDVSLDPLELIGLARAGVLASGDVRIYDEHPTGFLPAEGCGVVLLMRTADARTAGLPVYAEIAGWGTSASGSPADAGPSIGSQLLAMRRAYDRAGIDPADIQLFEGNGVGTAEDDEAELVALGALRAGAPANAVLGSVKANIGNAKAAAGVAGLIKTVLSLSNGVLPPSTGVASPHALITSGDARLSLPQQALDWPGGVRLAAISTLNTGGSNVHLVLRSEPAPRPRHERWRPRGLPVRSLDENSVEPRLLSAVSEPLPFLLHAADRAELGAALSRLADTATWLSDAELHDLACQLGREPDPKGNVRVGLVAAGQQQLAALAAEAAALLPQLTNGELTTRPGIFAADAAIGKVGLLLSGVLPGPGADELSPRGLADSVGRCLATLRWLESLDVSATGGVGHGMGALAGLAWAGALGQTDVIEIAKRRAEFLAASRGQELGATGSGRKVDSAALRAAIAHKFRLGPPRRQLISTATGAKIESIDDAIDLICSGFSGADKLAEAITSGARGATLLVETGPGHDLAAVAGELTSVHAVSLGAGPEDPAASANVAAALFAAGALGQPQPLFAGRSARSIDIGRDRTFITSPCETRPAEVLTPEPVVEEPAAATIAEPAVSVQQRRGDPDRGAGPVPWVRCFAEVLRPVESAPEPVADLAWRLHIAGSSGMRAVAAGAFMVDNEAPRTLAIVGDPAIADSRAVAVQAARDAIATGQLVVLTTGSGFSGFFAALHAEHPEIGVTVLRVPAGSDALSIAGRLGHAEPGVFKEFVVVADGSVHELHRTQVGVPGGGAFPLGPDDVVLISRSSGGGALALAQVFACCGCGVAIVGGPADRDDGELVAGLEQLRLAGARIGYEVVDIDDPAGLAGAVDRIEARLGQVTAIGHGVSRDDPVPLKDLTDAEIADRIARETATLDHLVGSIRGGQLRLLVTLGSVGGRYGLPGRSMIGLGSGALAGRAAQLARAARDCRSLHIEVPAWSTDRLGDPPELAADLAASGTAPIDVNTAARLLLKIMTSPDLPDRLAVHGRVGGVGAHLPTGLSKADLTAAGLPTGGRFVAGVKVYYPGIELVCAPKLSLGTDPYLADYQVDGMPVLPSVLAIDALAQAASVLAGRPLRAASNVRLESPIVIPAGYEAELRLSAEREGSTITATLRCADSSFAVDHARASFDCTSSPADDMLVTRIAAAPASLSGLSTGPSGLVDGAELYGAIWFQSGRFRRIALLPEITARSCRALARSADDEPWFEPDGPAGRTTFLLGSPGLNDAVLQTLQACVPHRRVRPAGCESVQFSGRTPVGPVEIRAVAEPLRTGRTNGRAPAAGADPAAPVHVPGQAPAPDTETHSPSPAAAAGDRLSSDRAERRMQARKPRRIEKHQSSARIWHRDPAIQRGGVSGEAATFTDGSGREGWAPGGLSTVQAQLWNIEAVDGSGHVLTSWRGVQLRDAGSLPRSAAWPPTLLSVFLERRAAELGLSEGLRITVSCGQPDGQPDPRGVAADRPPVPMTVTPAGSRNALQVVNAEGAGPLAGFGLTARAGGSVSCGWAAVDPTQRQLHPPAGMAPIYAQLRTELAEPAALLAARLQAIGDCLNRPDSPAADGLMVTRITGDGWALLEAGQARIACAVAELSGVSAPVAIALLTAPALGPEDATAAAPRPVMAQEAVS